MATETEIRLPKMPFWRRLRIAFAFALDRPVCLGPGWITVRTQSPAVPTPESKGEVKHGG